MILFENQAVIKKININGNQNAALSMASTNPVNKSVTGLSRSAIELLTVSLVFCTISLFLILSFNAPVASAIFPKIVLSFFTNAAVAPTASSASTVTGSLIL